ncbi:MAG: transcriptional regulator [Deltaproteobacteria bacterium SG8_13]|nr:MAG: transcriptional regulator [Deltaproteobacteria bacterium SG8_13]
MPKTENRIEEKVKPFRLVKYFTVTSLVFVFLGTIVLSILNTHWARAMLRQNSEDYALLIVENLNHQVFLQFVLPIALKYGQIQLRNKEQYDRLDQVVRNTLHSFNVETVNIYDIDNTISYSFNPELVGRGSMGGTGYRKALGGERVSRQIQQGNFVEILLGIPRESRMITFAPLRAEKLPSLISGPILGVVEIVQDLSEEYKTIFRYQILVICTSALVMLVLFIFLVFVVRRGERIIEARALERMRLKEQLSRAEHLSSLGEMAAAISHEIRNPLGIIRSSSELLKKKISAVDPSNPVPDIIIEESSRLNSIITDFLNFARPRTPALIPCNVEDVVEKNLTFLSTQREMGKYRFHKEFHGDLPEISADSAMLYQAFLNILINAIQAMPDGGRITIKTGINHQSVEVSFEDEGGGIPNELLERIWNPFFTTKEKGTGLGLGIVKKIIEMHGGRIAIQNRPEGGSYVMITLPIESGG